tara:strand:+ start:822 stop:1010 length:189 start_codon:yes stop_codon:yes gene_type:complete
MKPTLKSYTLPSRSKTNRTSQNLSKSMPFSNAPQTEKKTKRLVTMAKKYRGFGGELRIKSFE